MKANHQPFASCGVHDAHHAQRARQHDDRDQRHRHRDLVADELGRRAQAGEQRVLAVRRPAAEDDAVDADARHRHDVEQPDVDVGDVARDRRCRTASGRLPNGITAKAMSAGTRTMIGAAVNTHLSARAGVMSSLMNSFSTSASGCRMPCGPTRIGPEAHLHPGLHLALEQHDVHDRHEHRDEHHDDLDQRDDDGFNHEPNPEYCPQRPAPAPTDPLPRARCRSCR